MGFEQSRRSVLSRRRWMRRLLLASLCRRIAFTRNPLVGSVLEKLDTQLNTGNHRGFRVSQKKLPPNAGDFACLRSSESRNDPLRQRHSAAVGRLLKRLQVRGLVVKVPRSRRWRVTDQGRRLMGDTLQTYRRYQTQAA